MNDRALLYAQAEMRSQEVFGHPAGDKLHSFSDGFVAVRYCDTDRHLLLRDYFAKRAMYFEEARLNDMSVFVVPHDPEDIPPPFVGMIASCCGFFDHRDQDAHTIEDAAHKCRTLLALTQNNSA